MEDKIENLITIAGTKHKYQYTMLVLTVLIWINIDIIPISLPFLEKTPLVEYTVNGETVQASLNYTICRWADKSNSTSGKLIGSKKINNSNFTIVKIYPYSWVSEFEISCNPMLTGLLGSVCFLGSLISSFLFQYQAHSIGRKKTVIVNLVLFCGFLICFNFCSNIYMILACLFLVQLTPGSVCLASFINISESLCHYKRSFFGSIINSGFCICGIIYILLFKYTENWRVVFLISSVMTGISGLIYALYAVESPRYHLSQGNFKNFLFSLEIIAKNNHKHNDFMLCLHKQEFSIIFNEENRKNFSKDQKSNEYDNDSKSCQASVSLQGKLENVDIDIYTRKNSFDFINPTESHSSQSQTHINNIVDLISEKDEDYCNEFSDKINNLTTSNVIIKNIVSTNNDEREYSSNKSCPSEFYKFCISCFLWFSVSGNYYGLTIYLKHIPGDTYINGILIYSFEILAYFLSGFLINTSLLGRKNTMIIYFLVAVIGFGFLVMNFSESYILILFLITRFVVAGSFNILYTYSCEIYKTNERAMGFAYNSAFGKFGSIIFPMTIEILSQYVNFLYMIINLVCLICMFWMPETLNKPLDDFVCNKPEDIKCK
jgi:MFS family permease